MEEKSRIAELRGSIEEIKGRINSLETQLEAEEYSLSRLHTLLFYAENGMCEGQHFLLDGKEYVFVNGKTSCLGVLAYPLKYNGEVSRVGRWIYRSEYGNIVPIPMEK